MNGLFTPILILVAVLPGSAQIWEILDDGPGGIKYGLYANDTALLINAQYADTPYPNHVFQFSSGNWTDLATVEISSAGNPTQPFIIYKNKVICYHYSGMFGGGLFEYDETNWNAIASVGGKVWGLREYEDTLYIYGQFNSINGDSSLFQIVKYDGENFYPVADKLYFGQTTQAVVKDMVIYGGHVYAVGDIKTASGQYHIARWDGEVWQDVGDGFPYMSYPSKMTIHDGLLIINGWPIGLAGSGYPISAWDGETFLSMEGPLWPAGAESMLSYNGALYVSGYRMIASIPVPYFAKWDGERWCYFNTGPDVAHGMVEFQGSLYAHLFHSESGQPVHRIAILAQEAMPDSCGEVVYLGIPDDSLDGNSVRISPNPATSTLTITSQKTITSIHLTDLFGRVVLAQQGQRGRSEVVDVSMLAPSVYFVAVEADGVRVVQKVVVE